MDVGVDVNVGVARPRSARDLLAARWLPVVATVLSAGFFLALRPNPNDLQAALSRQSAAAHGVGLTYWFSWFSGGATPGQYSLLTPYVSTVFTAPVTGVLTALATTLFSYRAARELPYARPAVWIATFTAWLDIWSGRIPFALGCLSTVLVVIAVRERRPVVVVLASVLTVAFSPVSGAFVAFGLAALLVADPSRRRLALAGCVASGATILLVGALFGSPGPQGYSLAEAAIAAGTMLAFLAARPRAEIRLLAVAGAAGSLILVTFANGMGSNYPRLAWIVLPAIVVATARARRSVAVLAVLPALVMGGYETFQDLHVTRQQAAHVSYYAPLNRELDRVRDLASYRLEVVQDTSVHTGAYALLSHAMLARGWETQEDNQYDRVLLSARSLNAISFKVWLDDNAVGYVALAVTVSHDQAEHRLVEHGDLPYLHPIWRDADWVLYRVADATPIVAPPQRVVSSAQSRLVVRVRCACRFPIRLRYSKFLQATTADGTVRAVVSDDGTGWTDLRAPRPGRYVLAGRLAGAFH